MWLGSSHQSLDVTIMHMITQVRVLLAGKAGRASGYRAL
jgi:hypothetical protein